MAAIDTLAWQERKLVIIDQTLLPGTLAHIALASAEAVWEAIKKLRIRGAPAIGVCAAYGVVVEVLRQAPATTPLCKALTRETTAYLATSRPTAVNLFYALERMAAAAERVPDGAAAEAFILALEAEAQAIYDEDIAMCRAIGAHGAPLIQDGCGVLTHCNAGGLATSGYGTALAPMYMAQEQDRSFHVYADETRPLLQGARLTAWELHRAGIPVTLICDNMAAVVMREKKVQLVIVGADRIAANGDAANKIGTYGVALLAHAHGIPFYIAAPASTFDKATPSGSDIPIEERNAEEIACWETYRTAPEGIQFYNPAFDVTPASLISGFITDRGLLLPPYDAALPKALGWDA